MTLFFRDGAFTANTASVRAYAFTENDESDGAGAQLGAENLCVNGAGRGGRGN